MDLFDSLVSWENLIAAARSARKGKPRSRGLCSFEAAREQSLVELRDELRAGTYQPAPLRTFEIYDPKPRVISAAPYRDRVVHHALVQVLEPLWERSFIHHSYACRRGKGTHRALEACSHFARRHAWVLRADVRKFYPSVDHEILLGLLRRRVQSGPVLNLIQRILAIGDGERAPLTYFPGDDLFSPVERSRGLPIGNLTSQFFANRSTRPAGLARGKLAPSEPRRGESRGTTWASAPTCGTWTTCSCSAIPGRGSSPRAGPSSSAWSRSGCAFTRGNAT